MRFDITDLRLFVAIADAGGMGAGAARVGLSLPSASLRIRDMEAQAGAALLDRRAGGARPTERGRLLLDHARAILDRWQRMQDELGLAGNGLAGRVRLWVNSAAMADLVPDRLPPFLQRHASIAVDVEEHGSERILQALTAGLCDLGIAIGPVDPLAIDAVPLRPDPLVLLVPRGHPLSGRRRLALAACAAADMVGLVADNPLQRYIERHAAADGNHLRIRGRVGDFAALCRMVADGAGLAILPAAAARRCRGRLPVRMLALEDGWAARRLLLCRPRNRRPSARVQRLAEHLSAGDEGSRSRRREAPPENPAGYEE